MFSLETGNNQVLQQIYCIISHCEGTIGDVIILGYLVLFYDFAGVPINVLNKVLIFGLALSYERLNNLF